MTIPTEIRINTIKYCIFIIFLPSKKALNTQAKSGSANLIINSLDSSAVR